MPTNFYDEKFYQQQIDGSLRSARAVVNVILEFIEPKSVVDVGCGMGTWLAAFGERGIADVCGLDGDYVDQSKLLISADKFVACDLTKKVELPRKFDLVVSLEVAEHLPADSADSFVETLTALGNVVVFSAAIPGQGGVNHINEQWADYWRTLFAERDFVAVDCLRHRIWNNREIEVCYRQNVFFYVQKEHLTNLPILAQERQKQSDFAFSLVHPDLFSECLTREPTLRPLLKALPKAVSETVKQRIKKTSK